VLLVLTVSLGTDHPCPGCDLGHFPYLERNVAKNKDEVINSYITDMLSLEDHIEKAVRAQLNDLEDYPEVTRDLKQVLRKVEQHVSDLHELSERRKAKGPTDVIKKAGSAVLGLGAAAIDLVRTEGLPKNLRDDYTAFSLATIGYLMLHTTALSLEEREVAELARQNFADYAQSVTLLHNVIPGAVIRFLREEGLPVQESVLPQISQTIEEIWHAQSDQAPRAAETSIGQSR
jgi:ferritin-like metal-binding protein YciE